MDKSIMKKIGVLGGTFDPIHYGHTLPAKAVADHLALDTVLVIPTNIPPHKESPNIKGEHRAAMVRLACEAEPIFTCDERELKRDGFSFTLETLKELSQCYPDASLHFIMGLDSLLTFTTWHQYQDILSHCHLVVNTRPNYALNNLNQETKSLLEKHQVNDINSLNEQKSGGILLLPNNLPNYDKYLDIDLSSSEVRQRLINKQPCQHLLSPKVWEFINKNKLYR